jgi:hypothetical protein
MDDKNMVTFVGGPYDGLVLPGDDGEGTWMVVDGDERRAAYEPDGPGVLKFQGMLPWWI